MTVPTSPDPVALRAAAYEVLRTDPGSRAAHLRLYEVEQILGAPEAAVAHLRLALAESRIVTTEASETPAVTLLVLQRAGTWEANLPFDLVVDARRTTVHRFYLLDDDDERVFAQALPPHDAVLCAIAESDRAQRLLELAEAFAARSTAPVINRPRVVASLRRDRARALFAGCENVLAPPVERATRSALAALHVPSPLVVRPNGSQAGVGLALIGNDAELRAYLAADAAEQFFVMPFVDYRSADGFYRKYRIMFVDGRPYPYHLAISPNWMIHYYNASMKENAWMRDEEGRFVDDLGGALGEGPAAALDEIARAVELTYFGIDCALLRDGRLLLFEADAAMLVHGTDDPALFGYKRRAFERIQSELARTIEAIAGGRIPAK